MGKIGFHCPLCGEMMVKESNNYYYCSKCKVGLEKRWSLKIKGHKLQELEKEAQQHGKVDVKKLYELCQLAFASQDDSIMLNGLKAFEKELRDDFASLWNDIRREEEHQEANPSIQPDASNKAIAFSKGRRYQIQKILGDDK